MEHSTSNRVTPVPTPPKSTTRTSRAQAPKYRRGDIWFITASETTAPVGTELWPNRPAIIVSNNVSSNKSGFVQVVYLTTSARKRSSPTHIDVGTPVDDRPSMALCEQVHTVDISRLSRRLGAIAAQYLPQIDAALMFSLSISHNADHSFFKKWEQYIQVHGIDMAAEISALCAQTTDARVESLTRAIQMLAAERDSLRALYEASASMPQILHEVRTAMSNGTEPTIDEKEQP